jgi:hypothetical protein
LLACKFGFTQSLPKDFEGSIVTSDFIDFGGAGATVLGNPSILGIKMRWLCRVLDFETLERIAEYIRMNA